MGFALGPRGVICRDHASVGIIRFFRHVSAGFMVGFAMTVRAGLILALAGVVAALAGSCGGNRETALSVAGSTSMQPFVEMLAEEFMVVRPGTKVLVQGGGSTAGIQAVREGAAAVGMVSRELNQQEQDLTAVAIARDGIAVIVHPSNPISSLSRGQVKEVFDGRTTDFRDLGGKPGPIRPVAREEGSGTRGAFQELVMDGAPTTPQALVQNSSGSVREMVSRDPAAIGYISLGLVSESVKAVKIDGVEARGENVKNGTYKLARPFLLVIRGEPGGVAKEFIDYILSDPGQRLLEREGLIRVR